MKLSITHLLCFTLALATFKPTTEAAKKPPFACDTSNPLTKTYPFCKFTSPISERAKDLVSRLTLDEKILQLVDNAPGIPRLGIPAYEWWSEALHGLSFYGFGGTFFNGSLTSATGFPQVISTAATFDSKLWYRIGQVYLFQTSGRSLISSKKKKKKKAVTEHRDASSGLPVIPVMMINMFLLFVRI